MKVQTGRQFIPTDHGKTNKTFMIEALQTGMKNNYHFGFSEKKGCPPNGGQPYNLY